MRLARHGSFLCSAAVVPVRETCEEGLYELIMTILVLLGFQISVLAIRFWGVDVALIILPQMIEIYRLALLNDLAHFIFIGFDRGVVSRRKGSELVLSLTLILLLGFFEVLMSE